ncbi:hypothetical protein D9613_006580 [Agrocybe pediades]|uniref:Uncharacterized protein n=1 Tax=Agrocybe pediades TaxID=84607 RepID=A0A8H4VK45_9AGAR|nr:hypothetical protein D9613_006580 [Agrocybe pediades]
MKLLTVSATLAFVCAALANPTPRSPGDNIACGRTTDPPCPSTLPLCCFSGPFILGAPPSVGQ